MEIISPSTILVYTVHMSHSTHPEVVDPLVGDLTLDPVEGGVIAGAVLLLHKVGEVGHPGELVEVR